MDWSVVQLPTSLRTIKEVETVAVIAILSALAIC